MSATVRSLQHINKDMACAESVVGPCPWPSVGYLHLPTGRDHGFEYPGLILLSRGVNPYPHRRQLAIHELCHQWFGNHVTPKHWCDLWLSEGLATFLERKIAVGFS